jgi:glyceraldehyde-3-phosphate dehydrogenase/erythrose-4-phosphate dehydrogenase
MVTHVCEVKFSHKITGQALAVPYTYNSTITGANFAANLATFKQEIAAVIAAAGAGSQFYYYWDFTLVPST